MEINERAKAPHDNIAIPPAPQGDREAKHYFKYLNDFSHDLWLRAGEEVTETHQRSVLGRLWCWLKKSCLGDNK